MTTPEEEKLVNAKKIDLKDKIDTAKFLMETMDTHGWKKIISPMLDKMIEDCIGHKLENGMWDPGAIKLPDDKTVFHLSYRMALMDFNNRIVMSTLHVSDLEAAYIAIDEQPQGVPVDKQPMEDSPYAPPEEKVDGSS